MMKPRPSNVVRFEQLMYLSLGIQEIVFLWHWHADGLVLDTGIALSAQAVNIAVFVLFIWLAARRRKNWARRVLLAVWMLASIGYIGRSIPHYLTYGFDAIGVGSAINLYIQLIAMIFIFSGNSHEWFGPSPSFKELLEAVGVRQRSN
jgi:hypothetical protein